MLDGWTEVWTGDWMDVNRNLFSAVHCNPMERRIPTNIYLHTTKFMYIMWHRAVCCGLQFNWLISRAVRLPDTHFLPSPIPLEIFVKRSTFLSCSVCRNVGGNSEIQCTRLKPESRCYASDTGS